MHTYTVIFIHMRGYAYICIHMQAYAYICRDVHTYGGIHIYKQGCADMDAYAGIRHGHTCRDIHTYAGLCMQGYADMHAYAGIRMYAKIMYTYARICRQACICKDMYATAGIWYICRDMRTHAIPTHMQGYNYICMYMRAYVWIWIHM